MLKINDRYLFYTLVAIVALVPLLAVANRPMSWATAIIATFVLFALWTLTLSPQHAARAPALTAARLPMILLALACLWLALQYTGIGPWRTLDTHITAWQLVKTVSYLCIFILMLALVTSRRRLQIFAWMLLISGTFQAVYGTLGTLAEGTSASGSYVNRNHLAGYLEMTLAIGIGLLIADLNRDAAPNWRERLRRWVNLFLGQKAIIRICLALMVIGLILTHSRMGNTAFFGSMLLAALIGLIIFRRSSRGVVLLFGSLILIDTFLMGTYFGLDRLQQRIEQTNLATEQRTFYNEGTVARFIESAAKWFDQPDETSEAQGTEPSGPSPASALAPGSTPDATGPPPSERMRSLQDIIATPPADYTLRDLLLGTGAGTFYTVYPRFRGADISGPPRHAHNDYLEFGIEFGLLGAALLVVFVASVLRTALRVQLTRHSRLLQAMGFATMMGVFALAIHSTADFNLQIHANAVTFITLTALPFIAATLDRTS